MLERLIPCKAIPSELPALTQGCVPFGNSLGNYIFLSMAVRLAHSTIYHHHLPSTSRLLAAVPSPLFRHTSFISDMIYSPSKYGGPPFFTPVTPIRSIPPPS